MLYITQIPESFAPDFISDPYLDGRVGDRWVGTLSKQFKMSRSVAMDAFSDLLSGTVGKISLRRKKGGNGERAGWLLTFSPPKSVSIQALVAGDLRIVEAHEAAVSAVFQYIESRTCARVTREKVTNSVVTGKAIAAQFNRLTSRADDPHLHSHLVLMNTTQDVNGKTYAINAEWMFFERTLLGAVYRAKLWNEIRRLGYMLVRSEDLWEISGVDPSTIAIFSNRSQFIEGLAETIAGESNQTPPPSLRSAIAKLPGPARNGKSIDEMKKVWLSKLEGMPPALANIPKRRAMHIMGPKPEVVKASLLKLGSKTLKCPLGELKADVLNHGGGDYLIETVEQAMEIMRRGRRLSISEFHAHIGSAPRKSRAKTRTHAKNRSTKKESPP